MYSSRLVVQQRNNPTEMGELNQRETDDEKWYCPLLGRVIASGYCLDINYQRVGMFKPDVLKDVMRLTRLDVEGLSKICRSCPNQPLSDEDYAEMGVTEHVERKRTDAEAHD